MHHVWNGWTEMLSMLRPFFSPEHRSGKRHNGIVVPLHSAYFTRMNALASSCR